MGEAFQWENLHLDSMCSKHLKHLESGTGIQKSFFFAAQVRQLFSLQEEPVNGDADDHLLEERPRDHGIADHSHDYD